MFSAFKGGSFHFYIYIFQLGFALGQMFSLENALAFGLLTMACSPGGGSSNVWVNLLNGDLDLSLTMTTISTFGALGMYSQLFLKVECYSPYFNHAQ